MNEKWLEIADPEIDAQELMAQIEKRIAGRDDVQDECSPADVVESVRQEIVDSPLGGEALRKWALIWSNDCDLVPRHYKIDWRLPIIGPIHALVRRVIHAEIQRYLLVSLEKQSYLNRELVKILQGLAEENVRLRQKLEETDAQ